MKLARKTMKKIQNKFGSYKTLVPPFDRALKYLGLRQRSIFEIRNYLARKEYSRKEIEKAVTKLIELKFLNDDDFARNFTESKQRKGKSKRAIEFELKLKGIDKNMSDEIMEDAKSDFKTAFEYIEKRMHQFERYEKDEKQKKVISRLRSRGFDWNTISKVLKKIS